MVTSKKISLVISSFTLLVAATAATPYAHAANPLTPPSDWGKYFSGGPLKAGQTVTLPDGRAGVVVGDFRQIPNGTASSSNPGHFRYAVMVPNPAPKDASKDCPDFGLSVVTVEMVDGKMQVSPGAKDADKMIEDYKKVLGTYQQRVLAARKEGLEIQAKADAMFKKWNDRNDRSVKKFTTAEGYTSLAFDMALAGMADKAKKGLKTKGDLDKIFKEAMIDAVKEKLSGDLPLNAPGPEANTAAAAELTKGNIKAYLSQKLKDVPENGRAEVLTKVLVQFGALALDKGGEEDLSELAFEAMADVAVEVGLSRYPIAGPLAKEALELTKQLRGYLMTIEKLEAADAEFTTALNAFNESYGARQALELMKKNRKDLLKQASDALYKEDPALEAWVVEQVTEDMIAWEKAMARFAKDFPAPADKPAMGPPAPVDPKKPLLPIRDWETEGLYDTWRIPGYIENAGRKVVFAEVDRLGLRNKDYRPSRPSIGGTGFDPVDRLGGGLGGLGGGTPDLASDLRRIFRGPSAFERGPRLELMPPEPPKPTLDEKQLLERDCRLKRMAQAERDIPRIGPQVRRAMMLKPILLGDLDGVDLGGVPGWNGGRLNGTTPGGKVIVLPPTNRGRAGINR